MLKSRILAAVLLVGVVLFVVLYNDNGSMAVLYALLLLFLIALVSVLLSPWLLWVEEKAERRVVFRDETLPLSVELRNRNILPYGRITLNLHDTDLASYTGEGLVHFPLNPRSGITRTMEAAFPYRGVYTVGVRSVSVADFLGLFRLTFRVRKAIAVVVYPARDQAFQPPLKPELLSASASNLDLLQDNYADVTDVRKHDPSDDSKKIHWKLTAKRGELIVKNLQASVMNKSLVLVDARKTALVGAERAALEDAVVSGAASAVTYCARRRLPVELVYGEKPGERMEVRTPAELDGVYLLLAELAFELRSGYTRLLEDLTVSGGGCFNILLFTCSISEEYERRIREANRMGHHIVVYFSRAESDLLSYTTRQLLDSLRENGVHCEEIVTGTGESRQ